MTALNQLAAILIISLFWCCVQNCDVNEVAVYKVKLKGLNDGLIDDEKVRWTQVFGQIHNRSYALYHNGEPASPQLRGFIQTGNLDPLIEYGNEEPKVYDQFTATATGHEDTEVVLFLDAEHSLVSLISRLMPPNGHFIGIDSLDLCLHSSWIDEITIDLETLDANVKDNDDLPKPVEKLNYNEINEYGNSLRHHIYHQMPSVAQVEFLKIKEYSTKELNDITRKEIVKAKFKELKTEKPHYRTDYDYKNEITTKSSLQELEDLEKDPVGSPAPNNPNNLVIVVTKSPNFLDMPSEEISDPIDSMDEAVLAVANGKKLGLGKHLPRHFRSRLHHVVNRRHGKDCIVSDWSDWSPCSDPCSFKQRVREVVQENIGRGRPCPPLVQKEHCGRCVRGDGDYLW